jgi:hypothetical protein
MTGALTPSDSPDLKMKGLRQPYRSGWHGFNQSRHNHASLLPRIQPREALQVSRLKRFVLTRESAKAISVCSVLLVKD